MGTLGVALEVCSVPGAPPATRLGADDIELGLGLHGEPGFESMRWCPLDELVPRMLRRILSYKGGSGAEAHRALNSGAPLALLVNNLGGSSNLEMTAVVHEALTWLKAQGVGVSFAFVGCACWVQAAALRVAKRMGWLGGSLYWVHPPQCRRSPAPCNALLLLLTHPNPLNPCNNAP